MWQMTLDQWSNFRKSNERERDLKDRRRANASFQIFAYDVLATAGVLKRNVDSVIIAFCKINIFLSSTVDLSKRKDDDMNDVFAHGTNLSWSAFFCLKMNTRRKINENKSKCITTTIIKICFYGCVSVPDSCHTTYGTIMITNVIFICLWTFDKSNDKQHRIHWKQSSIHYLQFQLNSISHFTEKKK